MTELFDIISDISENKKIILKSKDDFKKYPQYMINKAFMQYRDSIMPVAFINRYPNIIPEMHYKFLMGMIKKRKRRGTWSKKIKIKDVEIIKSYYNIGEKKAIEYLKFLKKDDIKKIKTKMNTGGLV